MSPQTGQDEVGGKIPSSGGDRPFPLLPERANWLTKSLAPLRRAVNKAKIKLEGDRISSDQQTEAKKNCSLQLHCIRLQNCISTALCYMMNETLMLSDSRSNIPLRGARSSIFLFPNIWTSASHSDYWARSFPERKKITTNYPEPGYHFLQLQSPAHTVLFHQSRAGWLTSLGSFQKSPLEKAWWEARLSCYVSMSFILHEFRAQNQPSPLWEWESQQMNHIYKVLDAVLVDSGKYQKKKKKNTQSCLPSPKDIHVTENKKTCSTKCSHLFISQIVIEHPWSTRQWDFRDVKVIVPALK